MRTLIVEDDFASRFVLQRMFQNQGICHTAVDGEEGLESFKLSNENGELYDLICLDIMMPKMDGKELLKKIRDLEENEYKTPREKRSKIIMITALNDYDNIKSSFMNLCDGYIFKPFKKEKITAEVKKLGLIME